jgi:hypothetical protein
MAPYALPPAATALPAAAATWAAATVERALPLGLELPYRRPARWAAAATASADPTDSSHVAAASAAREAEDAAVALAQIDLPELLRYVT